MHARFHACVHAHTNTNTSARTHTRVHILPAGKKRNKANVVTFSNKHNRKWQEPNLQHKKVYWEQGQRWVKLRICTKAIKTIEKVREAGGSWGELRGSGCISVFELQIGPGLPSCCLMVQYRGGTLVAWINE